MYMCILCCLLSTGLVTMDHPLWVLWSRDRWHHVTPNGQCHWHGYQIQYCHVFFIYILRRRLIVIIKQQIFMC